jgi:TDG/mug DNA glycosylase family protein
MQSCVRETSLDSDIEEASIVANPFDDFLTTHSGIRTICFNGAKAESAWRKHVIPKLSELGDIAYHRLPSTSPANASIRYDDKVGAWTVALSGLPSPPR